MALRQQDTGPRILIGITTAEAIAAVFVLARLYVRGRIMGRWHCDDYLIIASILLGWMSVCFTFASVASGSGRHIASLSEQQQSGAVFWAMLAFVPGVFSIGLPKLAVVAFLARIMNPSRRHRIFMWCMTSLCMMNLGMCMVMLFTICKPAAARWDFSTKQKNCWNPDIMVYWGLWSGAYSAFCDLYLAVYPSVVLYKLQMSRKKKIALSGALGIGSVATVIAVYKTTNMYALTSPDFTYDGAELVICTIVEGSMIIVAACVPVLQPLMERIFGRRGWFGRDWASTHGKRQKPSTGDYHAQEKWSRAGYALPSDRGPKRPHSDEDLLTTTMNGSREHIPPGQMIMNNAKAPTVPPAARMSGKRTFSWSIEAMAPISQQNVVQVRRTWPGKAERVKKKGTGIVKTQSVTVLYAQETSGEGPLPV